MWLCPKEREPVNMKFHTGHIKNLQQTDHWVSAYSSNTGHKLLTEVVL